MVTQEFSVRMIIDSVECSIIIVLTIKGASRAYICTGPPRWQCVYRERMQAEINILDFMSAAEYRVRPKGLLNLSVLKFWEVLDKFGKFDHECLFCLQNSKENLYFGSSISDVYIYIWVIGNVVCNNCIHAGKNV